MGYELFFNLNADSGVRRERIHRTLCEVGVLGDILIPSLDELFEMFLHHSVLDYVCVSFTLIYMK